MYLNGEAAMLEGVASLIHPLLKSSFIDDRKPWQEVHFGTLNGINGSTANPR